MILLLLHQFLQSILILIEMVLRQHYLLIHLYLWQLELGPPSPGLIKHTLFLDYFLLYHFPVPLLPLLIPLHEIKYIDRIHVQISQILWSFDLLL